MRLFIGLGNPGARYARNRHNIGFMAVDRIAEKHGFGPWRAKYNGEIAEGRLGGDKALLLKPQTFMNESGRSAMQPVRMFKIPLDDVIVFYDELDLAPGKLRVRTGGGAAGHNGVRSLTAHIGADFRRVRLGIGHPGDRARVTGWVLGDFAAADADWLGRFLDAIAAHAGLLAATPPGAADSDFMSKVALDAPAPKSKPAETDSAKG